MNVRRIQEKLKGLVEQYGVVALVTYFGIFFLCWGVFALAFNAGVELIQSDEVRSKLATAGAVTAGYVANKVIQPLRIAATILLTPLIARLVRRGRRPTTPSGPPPDAQA